MNLRTNKTQSTKSQSVAGRVVQKKTNNTGFPDNLKSGIERLSGYSMDDVKVHYSSAHPAQLLAHAFTQGNQIHLAACQEKHLPHEAWHVVQQKQGRVKPTMQLKSSVPVNDDPGLEKEADVMGARAVQFKSMEHLGYRDVTFAQMSHQQYGQWKDTVQGKFDVHAASAFQGGLIVTQFKNPNEVLQMAGFFPAGLKGALLIAEGILTVAGGIAGLYLSAGVGTFPGAVAIGIGVVKIGRGIFTIYAGEEPSGKQKALMDSIRAVEGAAALIGGAIAGNPAVVIFGLAKSIRSLLMAATDYMGKDTHHPVARKALLELSTACHALEVFAGIGGGVGFLEKAGGATGSDAGIHKGIGAVTFIGSASKAARTVDQGKASQDAHPEVNSPTMTALRNFRPLPLPLTANHNV
ncbi:DUF4157 domain-containing protein [Ekhidna sp.]|uniref:eCIS core domain-containing protein n=1 Tax=Ekhidna sp. TaxID=2608089 RepID=UPI0032990D7F